MTLEELGEKIREVIPTAEFAEDFDGQLVIYTNLVSDEDGNVVERA